MTKVQVHDDGPASTASAPAAEKPSEELVRRALKEETLEGLDGRKYLMRKPSPLAQFRIVEAVGPTVAANQTYMQMVTPLIYLGAIDGDSVPLPMSHREVEALITRLDEAGLDVVMNWYMANILEPMAASAEADVTKARLKN